MSRYVFFDVGANWGEDSLSRCRDNPDVEVWAFEPTPRLVQHLYDTSIGFRDRYCVVPMAVSDFDGLAEFYIQNNAGMGCNSLNTFNQDAITKYWEKRNDELSSAESFKAHVCKLETWITNYFPEVKEIDFFHCDTQGSDLKVLKGMGDYIHLIKEGKIECSKNNEIKLYNESTNFIDDVCLYLEIKGFEITEVESNDHSGNELNVYFRKR